MLYGAQSCTLTHACILQMQYSISFVLLPSRMPSTHMQELGEGGPMAAQYLVFDPTSWRQRVVINPVESLYCANGRTKVGSEAVDLTTLITTRRSEASHNPGTCL